MESEEYKEDTIKLIKAHLEYLLNCDYSKWDGVDLMKMEHILYYHLVQNMEGWGETK